RSRGGGTEYRPPGRASPARARSALADAVPYPHPRASATTHRSFPASTGPSGFSARCRWAGSIIPAVVLWSGPASARAPPGSGGVFRGGSRPQPSSGAAGRGAGAGGGGSDRADAPPAIRAADAAIKNADARIGRLLWVGVKGTGSTRGTLTSRAPLPAVP